jgi:hypothetical protein
MRAISTASALTRYTMIKGSGASTSSRVPATRPRRPRFGNNCNPAQRWYMASAIRRAAGGLSRRIRMTIPSKSSAASGDHLTSIRLKQSVDPLADCFVGNEFAPIERGQTFHDGFDKIHVSREKSLECLLDKLVRRPAVTRGELDKASFQFRCEAHLHEIKLTTTWSESSSGVTPPASRPCAGLPRTGRGFRAQSVGSAL